MSKLSIKTTSPILKKLLKDPLLPEKIQKSTPGELVRWIDEIGLEDSGEILAFASTQQIEMIFDIDLWKSHTKGGDEVFDPNRFGVWLEILSEISFSIAAKKIVEMDEDFLILSFSRLALVAETAWLGEISEGDSRLEKLIESKLFFEIDRFTLFSKNEENWDTFISILLEMDSHHHNILHRILERCSGLLIQESESEGLYEVLSADEQLTEDVAHEREKRRESQGYVTPAIARAFLKLCNMSSTEEDHITPKHLLKPSFIQMNTKQEMSKFELTKNHANSYQKIGEIFSKNQENSEFFSEQINYLANVLMSGWDWPLNQKRPGRAIEIVLEVCEETLTSNLEPFRSFPRTFQIGFKHWLKKHHNLK